MNASENDRSLYLAKTSTKKKTKPFSANNNQNIFITLRDWEKNLASM